MTTIKRTLALLLAFAVTLLAPASAATAAAETTEKSAIHVEQTLQSPFLKLDLNADVTVYEKGTPLTIYTTDYARSDSAKWIEMFFGSADADVQDLVQVDEKNRSYYPDIERTYEKGDVFAHYTAYETRLYVTYEEFEITRWWSYAQIDEQAQGLHTTPQQAKDIAWDWVNRLDEIIGWDGFKLSACYTMPAVIFGMMPDAQVEESEDESLLGYYVVEFDRVLSGIPVAHDEPPYTDDTKTDMRSDVIQIYIDDRGIFLVEGQYRSFLEAKNEQLLISLDDAIGILRDHMDYVMFYPEEPNCEIDEMSLCYRLVQTLDTSDKDVNARMEARPAWRFASGVNRHMTDVFVMFIDAVTGEVLP